MSAPCKGCPDRQRNESGVTICQTEDACDKWRDYIIDKMKRKDVRVKESFVRSCVMQSINQKKIKR